MQKNLKTWSIPFTLSEVEGHPERSRRAPWAESKGGWQPRPDCRISA